LPEEAKDTPLGTPSNQSSQGVAEPVSGVGVIVPKKGMAAISLSNQQQVHLRKTLLQ